MPIYIDESGGVSAGAMTMAGVENDEADAERLLSRFRTVTGLRGELKGSRIDLVQRALFFELLERFGGRARICMASRDTLENARMLSDFDVYVGLLTHLVEDWLPETGGCAHFIVDQGRYDTLVLEKVRLDIATMLASFGTARLADSARCPGVQIADVVANSYYNLAIHSGRAHRIAAIVEPFVQSRLLRSRPLTHLDRAPGGPIGKAASAAMLERRP